MATGNLFLGTARRSVGDITLYRRNGVQVARTRVRNVANPKTTGQSTQRTFFAPVARFYSPFAKVLETSYEGLNRTDSFSRFLKENIALARTQGWYLPKGANFAPLPYKLSRGSIAPLQVAYDPGALAFNIFLSGISDATTVGQISQAFINVGYREGDQVTIIAIMNMGGGDYLPDWLRFNLSTASAATITSLYEGRQFSLGTASSGLQIVEGEYALAAGAAIVSRYDGGVWRRSTQYLVLADDELEDVTSSAAREAAIASYGPTDAYTSSDVYLNGTNSFVIVQTSLSGTPEVTVVALEVYSGQSGSIYVGRDSQGHLHAIKDNRVDSANFGKFLGSSNTWIDGPTGLATYGDLIGAGTDQTFTGWLIANGVPASVF